MVHFRGRAAAPTVVVLGLVAAMACGDDPVGVITAELAGTWVAGPDCAPPCALTLQSVEDATATLDLVTLLFTTLEIRIGEDGAFSLTVQAADSVLTLSGTARAVGGALIVAGEEGVDTVDYAIVDGFLELDFREEWRVWDFDDPPDGTLDAATASAVLSKR